MPTVTRTARGRRRAPRPAAARYLSVPEGVTSRRSLAPQIPVHHLDGGSRLGQPGGELLGHGHAAVLAAGAADGEGDEPFALPLESGERRPHRLDEGVKELLGARLAEHVVA